MSAGELVRHPVSGRTRPRTLRRSHTDNLDMRAARESSRTADAQVQAAAHCVFALFAGHGQLTELKEVQAERLDLSQYAVQRRAIKQPGEYRVRHGTAAPARETLTA